MKIALATIFYQCAKELQRLVDSIPDKVIDYWICVDGPFRYNLDRHPDLPHKSDDGSLTVISDAAPKFNYNVIINYKYGGATEFDKRNTYLENCEKLGDINVIIIVDSDEYFIYNHGIDPVEAWNRLRKNIEIEMIQHPFHNVYGIPYAQKDSPSDTYKPRIWTRPEKMRYINGSHYHYANIENEQQDIETFKQNRLNYVQQARSIIKSGVIMTHDQSLRTKEYQERRRQYQQYLVSYEERIQSYKHTHEEADRLAKENPATSYDP
jgi:hypothetical protein